MLNKDKRIIFLEFFDVILFSLYKMYSSSKDMQCIFM